MHTVDKAAAYDAARAAGMSHEAAMADVDRQVKAEQYDRLRAQGLDHATTVHHIEAARSTAPVRTIEGGVEVAPTAPGPRREESTGEKVLGFARDLNPLGSFKDEAAGAMAGLAQGNTNLLKRLGGRPITRSVAEAYRNTKGTEAVADEMFNAEHPIAGMVAKTAGMAIPGVLSAGATTAGALPLSFGGRVAQGAGTMAAWGAGNRLGEGDGIRDRLERASDPTSVGTDLAIGAVLPVAAEGMARRQEITQAVLRKLRQVSSNPVGRAAIGLASPRAGHAMDLANRLMPEGPPPVQPEPDFAQGAAAMRAAFAKQRGVPIDELMAKVPPKPPTEFRRTWPDSPSPPPSRGALRLEPSGGEVPPSVIAEMAKAEPAARAQQGATRARLRADEARLDLPEVTPEPPQGTAHLRGDPAQNDAIMEAMKAELGRGQSQSPLTSVREFSPGNPWVGGAHPNLKMARSWEEAEATAQRVKNWKPGTAALKAKRAKAGR